MTHPLMRNYFNADAQALFNTLVEESIEFAGIECWYLPREIQVTDAVLNEIYMSRFKDAYKISVFREEVGGFFPNDFFVQKFGPEYGGGNTVFAVSKSAFAKITGDDFPPQGSMLVFPDVRQIYEVRDIDTRDPWISNGKMYYWKLSCAPFERNNKQKIYDDVFDYLDNAGSEILEEFQDMYDVWDSKFFTADSTCLTVDTTKHLASENMTYDYFLPVTADREDITADDDTWRVDIDQKKINTGTGSQNIIAVKYPDYSNGAKFSAEAKKYLVETPYGFE